MKHSYHAQHPAPQGSGSFLLGLNGAAGGFVAGAAAEGRHDVFVGYRYAGESWTLLPFAREAVVGAAGGGLSVLPHGRYGRTLGWATDRWMAQALVFLLATPFASALDRAALTATDETILRTPAVYGLLDFDNGHMEIPVELVFAIGGSDNWRVLRDLEPGLCGVTASKFGFATRAHTEVEDFVGSGPLGVPAAGIVFRIPAGGKAVFPLVLGWSGGLPPILAAALAQFTEARALAQRRDDELRASGLPDDARRQVSLATRECLAASGGWADVDVSLAAMRARARV